MCFDFDVVGMIDDWSGTHLLTNRFSSVRSTSVCARLTMESWIDPELPRTVAPGASRKGKKEGRKQCYCDVERLSVWIQISYSGALCAVICSNRRRQNINLAELSRQMLA